MYLMGKEREMKGGGEEGSPTLNQEYLDYMRCLGWKMRRRESNYRVESHFLPLGDIALVAPKMQRLPLPSVPLNFSN